MGNTNIICVKFLVSRLYLRKLLGKSKINNNNYILINVTYK